MPRQHVAEMPNDHQPFVVIDVVKSSEMNKPRKEAGIGPYLKKKLSQSAIKGVS